MNRLTLRSAAMAAAMVLAGCTVGPDYAGPPRMTADHATRFVRAGTVPTPQPAAAAWWTVLGDPVLDRIEAAAMRNNPDLDAARARLREARATRAGARAALLPSDDASAIYLHAHGGGGGLLASDLDLYDIGFDASWEADLFGGQKRALEAAGARAQAREFDLADTGVSLSSDIARAYVSLRDAQHRLHLLTQSAALQSRMLDLTRERAVGGTASDLDVARLDAQLQDTVSGLSPLRSTIAEQLDRLAILCGESPGALDATLAVAGDADVAVPAPPRSLAVGDPAALLRRRPDIRAAERDVAAQNAEIGQRIADYFPKLGFTGNLGFASTDAGTLFAGSNLLALVLPTLQWKPFDFGRTRAKVDQAKAGLGEAEATYRGTVLRALDDAETSLARYTEQRSRVTVLRREQDAADRAAALQRKRFAGGTASLIDTLDTERQRVAAQQALAEAQAVLTTDFVAIEKSVGLGWRD